MRVEDGEETTIMIVVKTPIIPENGGSVITRNGTAKASRADLDVRASDTEVSATAL
jgi:hypothetical protein